MKILVSACLTGCACRYDGRDNLVALPEGYVYVPVCPEVLGGLSVPRVPCEQKGDRVIGQDGADYTAAFVRGAEKALQICLDNGCTHAILKARSPSCGKDRVYNGCFNKELRDGDGVFVQLLRQHGISIVTEEELDRLFL